LFVKHSLGWPRASGHDVHTYEMMKACAALGHEVGLATVAPIEPVAVLGVSLAVQTRLSNVNGEVPDGAALQYSRLQERYRSYWGVERQLVASLHAHQASYHPDAVVVVGLEALPFLPAIEGPVRVWYAADEWVWHHLSLIQATDPGTWSNLKVAAVKGLYERVYAPLIDRAWVVSAEESRAMRWLAGVSDVDVLPNGVDSEFYRPEECEERPFSAVFWGRLDFEPNVQGLGWFCRRVWPRLRARVEDARFTIIGFHPIPQVEELGRLPGVEVKRDLPDLRREVAHHSVVVLPLVSGGGIKNKLLEAAAMGKPIIGSPFAAKGLRSPSEGELILAATPEQWVESMLALWSDPERRRRTGAAARNWVTRRHTWAATAAVAVDGIAATLQQRGRRS
jgi:glycosyltransferase involved in cell wall biosynthesis